MMNIPVKIKKLHPAAVIPSYAKVGDSGFDLVAIEDTLIQPGQTVKIRTGLAMAIPAGYEVQVRPRSGVSSKTKLRVILGTIDSGYRGEVGVLVDNICPIGYGLVQLEDEFGRVDEQFTQPYDEMLVHTLDGGTLKQDEVEARGIEHYFPTLVGTYIIRRGDRIAQGVLAEVPTAIFEEVDELDETERGAGGFGSSGTR